MVSYNYYLDGHGKRAKVASASGAVVTILLILSTIMIVAIVKKGLWHLMS